MRNLEPRTFRRLRLSDAAALDQLCKQDRRWFPHFYKHEKWLERALETIGSDGRVVFGGFIDVHDSYGRSLQRLDSAIFLRVSEHTNSAELKNLVLRDEGTGQKLSPDGSSASVHLIKKAVRFCEMRDIAKLEIDLPESEHAFISIFVQEGFRILSHRERYFAGHSVYSLEKLIGETYYGDPFDRQKLGTWLLRAILPCRVGPWKNFGDQNEVLSYFSFEIFPPHPQFSESNSVGFGRRLQGGLFILDESHCTPRYFERLEGLATPKENHVNYLMADRIPRDRRSELESRGFVCFDRQEVRAIAGGDDSSLRIPIDEEEAVGGVLTVLEEPLVRKYADLGPRFVYYLLGGIGSSLEVAPTDEQPTLLAVHCPRWEKGQPSIVAVAEVIDILDGDIRDAHDHFSQEIPRALSKDELEFYTTREEGGERVFSLLCSQLRILPKPLAFTDPIWQDHSEMHEYLVTELEHANTAYLNEAVCDVLRELTSGMDPPKVTQMDKERLADVVVIAIREDEHRAVLDRLQGARPLAENLRGAYVIGDAPANKAGKTYRVAVVRTQEQGQSAAQFAAQNAIEDLGPQWLAVVGIAGAVPDNEFGLGDVVVASRVQDFSVSAALEDAEGNRSTQYTNQGGPMARAIGNLMSVLPSIMPQSWCDDKNIAVARPNIDGSEDKLYGSDEWKDRTRSSLLYHINRARPTFTFRTVGSSGTLVKDTVTLQGFRNHSRDVAHVEMEVAGVYHAANTVKRVYPILAVRGISDVVGLKRDPAWTGYACNAAAAFFFTLLQVLPEGFLEKGKDDLASRTA